MKENTCKKVRLAYGVVFGVFTVVVGALLIWQTLDLYLSGHAADYTGQYVYTRERVAERLAFLAPALWIWVAAAVAGFVLWEIFPVPYKSKTLNDPRYALCRMKKRMPRTAEDDLRASYDFVKREERVLLILRLLLAAFCLAGAIYGVVYLAIPSHFPKTDVTGEVLAMVKNLLPWAFVAFALGCGLAAYEGFSAKKQLAHVKLLTKGMPVAEQPFASEKLNRISAFLHGKAFLWGVRGTVCVVAVVFVALGVSNGNMTEILKKAINICTECIGLG